MKKVPEARILDTLADISLFDTLKSEDLQLLVQFVELHDYDDGETIFSEGDTGDFACFVVSGELDVLKETGDGHIQIAQLSHGRSIGEMSLIDGSPRSASAVASSAGRFIVLPREQFHELLEQYPRIGVRLLHRMARLMSLNLRKTSAILAEVLS